MPTTRKSPLTKILTLTLVAAALGAGSADAHAPFSSAAGDFNGDGRDDIASFTRGQSADVHVSLTGFRQFGAHAKWHDLFATGTSIPVVGDFTCDGIDDVASFSRGVYGQVHVAASNRSRFVNTGGPWISSFARGDAVPQVGDFNNDGCSDIASFTSDAGVWVALSTGSAFTSARMWLDLDRQTSVPVVGDFSGDGFDDVGFANIEANLFLTAHSNGSAFDVDRYSSMPWSENLAPAAGDVDGDGDDDVVAFLRGTSADVYVMTSQADHIDPPVLWNSDFAAGNEIPGVGDFTGDAMVDVVSFTRGTSADAFVAQSDGSGFVRKLKWHDSIVPGGEVPGPGSGW